MNITLLWDPELQERQQTYTANNPFMQQTPTDDEVDALYDYLDKIWDHPNKFKG